MSAFRARSARMSKPPTTAARSARPSSQRPALCVMDIRLAGSRDGIEAAIEIFMAHGIRCIFATAHADPEARVRAEKAVPHGWLQKPLR